MMRKEREGLATKEIGRQRTDPQRMQGPVRMALYLPTPIHCMYIQTSRLLLVMGEPQPPQRFRPIS